VQVAVVPVEAQLVGTNGLAAAAGDPTEVGRLLVRQKVMATLLVSQQDLAELLQRVRDVFARLQLDEAFVGSRQLRVGEHPTRLLAARDEGATLLALAVVTRRVIALELLLLLMLSIRARRSLT